MKKSLSIDRKQLFTIVEVGSSSDRLSRGYDFFNVGAICVNLIVSVLLTFDEIALRYALALEVLETLTVLFFTLDYALRLYTAKYLYPKLPEWRGVLKYVFSFTGLVDLFSFLPYFLPFFFPSGVVAFRIFRIVRIFRLFRVSAYYDSLNVITEVLASRWQQLLSSFFIILVLMLASSLCMYSLEHEAQPEVFQNAFSGIWWSVSTLLTVGYGDIYPVTPLGQVFGIIIAFLGVGMVAIPTGIISAGFVEQYSRLKRISEYAQENDINFIKIQLEAADRWVGRAIRDLGLPFGVIVAAIRRRGRVIVPRGEVVLKAEDVLVLGAEALLDESHVDLKEVTLRAHHPWNAQLIRDLDISRQTLIVMVERGGKMLIPRGDLCLMEGDKVILYSQTHISDAEELEI